MHNVIDSENKLHELGYVDYYDNLTLEERRIIDNSKGKYYTTWRGVWNENSLSTPCRLVFDASQANDQGYSLNDILAKGNNSLNKLVEILIRWTTHKVAFHTDIQKMYNTVQLDKTPLPIISLVWQLVRHSEVESCQNINLRSKVKW